MTVYSAAIAASADDANEADNGSGFNAAATSNRMDDSTTASARFNNGARYPGTGIPEGSTINVGTFVTWNRQSSFDSPDATLYCELNATSPNFSDNADVTSRAVTATGVAYAGANLGAGNKNTPDLAAAVQEVVSLSGFNGTITTIFKGNNNTAGEGWRSICFDTTDNTLRTVLTVDYTEPVGGGGVLVQRTLVGVGI